MSLLHKLNSKWCFWEQVPSVRNDANVYLQGMQVICSFDSVEGFWGCWQNLIQPVYIFIIINI